MRIRGPLSIASVSRQKEPWRSSTAGPPRPPGDPQGDERPRRARSTIRRRRDGGRRSDPHAGRSRDPSARRGASIVLESVGARPDIERLDAALASMPLASPAPPRSRGGPDLRLLASVGSGPPMVLGDPVRDEWDVVRTAPTSYLRGTALEVGSPGWPPTVDRALRRWRTDPGRLSFAVLVGGAAFIAAYFLAFDTAAKDLLYQVPGMIAPIGVVAGILRYRPADPRPWIILAAGLSLTVAGDWTWVVLARMGLRDLSIGGRCALLRRPRPDGDRDPRGSCATGSRAVTAPA